MKLQMDENLIPGPPKPAATLSRTLTSPMGVLFVIAIVSLVNVGTLLVTFRFFPQLIMHNGAVSIVQNQTVNVLDFGAVSDCSFDANSDNTRAFQLAIASLTKGGFVDAPAGCYHFWGSITVSNGVSIRGSYSSVPSHKMVDGKIPITDGSVLMPHGGKRNASDTPFITLTENTGIQGLVIFYPDQTHHDEPIPYPWTISFAGRNTLVRDVELLNPWNGISAVGSDRHMIQRVQGQPLNIGISVDETYDIGRIEDVHFNPWYSPDPVFMKHQLVYGRAFVMGRSDWEYVFNTFAFGYAVGYHFVETSTGAMNGNFLGIGADLCINASVLVEASQAPGILITNGEFTAFHSPEWITTDQESTHIVVTDSNTGPVNFVDCSFWGPCSQVLLQQGTGTVTLDSCELVEWDEQASDGRAALRVLQGSLIAQGCQFGQNKTQLDMSNADNVIMVGNLFQGQKNFVGSATRFEEAANIFNTPKTIFASQRQHRSQRFRTQIGKN